MGKGRVYELNLRNDAKGKGNSARDFKVRRVNYLMQINVVETLTFKKQNMQLLLAMKKGVFFST